MRVLIACEESQRVCIAFRERGHEAYSCDLLPCSGGHPEWHIQADAQELLKLKWDLLIARPPCTYLTAAGATRLYDSNHKIKDDERYKKGLEAKAFFLRFLEADCPRVCVENPAPLHIYDLPPASQRIEPYMFGDPWKKRTYLWLRGLPILMATEIVIPEGCWVSAGGGYSDRTRHDWYSKKGTKSAKLRSRTFPGVAAAMASQWGNLE